MARKKILFVVDTLAQHGAERYLYELTKILLKNDFCVTVYSIVWLDDKASYYVKLLEELGVRVNIRNLLPYPNIKSYLVSRAINTVAYRVLDNVKRGYIENKLEDNFVSLLNEYDIVSIIKWEVYIQKRNVFDKIGHKKLHLMSVLGQYNEFPYDVLPKGKTDIVLMYPEQKTEFFKERIIKENYKISTIPLLIDNDNWTNQYNPKDDVLRIGMFSRIHYDQPTIFSLFIVHELKNRNIPIELCFFGRYYDEQFYNHYTKTVEILKISSQVKFMGHVESIPDAIKDNNISIGLMNALDFFIGYSSIEIQSHGLPVIFFNVTESGYSSQGFPIILNTIKEVCDKIETLWLSGGLAELSLKTFKYSKENFGAIHNTDNVLNVFNN